VVVVLGSLQLARTANIEGSVVVVAGTLTVADGARIRRDAAVVGGTFEAPPGFSPGGEHFVLGPPGFGDRLRALVPWLTQGLLWGRVIVPSLGWVWGVVAMFLILSLAVSLALHGPVGRSADTLATRPITSFLVGLLVLLLIGPVSILLTATVVGIAVVPFLFCAVIVAWIVGKVGVSRVIGRAVTTRGAESEETRAQALLAVAVGFAGLCLLYMIPIVGLVSWALVGVFGLGSATLAFISELRRERPARAPKPAAPPPAPPLSPMTPPVPPVIPPSPSPVAAQFSAPAAAATPAPSPTAAAPVAGDLALLPRATLLDRLAAFAIDVALVILIAGMLDFGRRVDPLPVLMLGYFIAFWAWKGTTIGGIICNLRVVRTDGSPLRFADAFVRGLGSILSWAVFAIGCLWILRDPDRQAWHDLIAGTYVVRVPRNYQLA